MNKVLVFIHNWIGIGLGVFFALVMITGVVLTVEEAIVDRLDEKHALAFEEKSVSEVAADVSTIIANLNGAVPSNIRTPTEVLPTYKVTIPGKVQYYSAVDLALVHEEAAARRGGGGGMAAAAPAMAAAVPVENSDVMGQQRAAAPSTLDLMDAESAEAEAAAAAAGRDTGLTFFGVMRSLHVRLMWGNGAIVGWLGLLGTIIGMIGIVVWWRYRRAFRWSRIWWPKKNNTAEALQNHMQGGIVASVFLVLFGLTGAFLGVRGMLNSMVVPTEAPNAAEMAAAPKITPVRGQEFASWDSIIGNATKAIDSDAVITDITGLAPRGGDVAVKIRYATSTDIHPLGVNFVYMDPYTAEPVKTYGAENMSVMRWIANSYRPLHTGSGMPLLYILIVAFGSLMVTITTVSGVWAFIRRQFNLDKRKVRVA